ncbi:MAG: CDC27 family protein [bacterium]
MRKCFAVGVFVLIALGCSKSPEESILDLFKTGQRHVDHYEFDAAIDVFKQVAAIDSTSPLSGYGIGLVFERQLQWYDALHSYLVVNRRTPSFAPAHLGVFRIMKHLEESEDAFQAASEYSALLPDESQARLVLAQALINVGQYVRARQEADRAAELGAEADIVSVLKAESYCRQGFFDSAAVAYQTATEQSSGSTADISRRVAYLEAAGLIDSSITVGRLTLTEADFDLALDHFFRCLRHHYYFEARQVISNFREYTGTEMVVAGLEMFLALAIQDQVTARKACDQYGKLVHQSISALAFDLQVRGRSEDMMTCTGNVSAIGKIMGRDRYDPKFQEFMWYTNAVTYAGFFPGVDGLKALEKVPEVMANRLSARLTSANNLYRSGQHDEFEELMSLLYKYHSTQPDWLAGLADIYADRFVRKYDLATRYYQLALGKEPWNRPAFEGLVEMYRRIGQPQTALEQFDGYADLERNFPELSLLKAVCLVESGAIEEGVTLFVQRFPAVRGNLVAFEEISTLVDKLDRQSEKNRLIELLLQLDQDNTDALVLLAGIKCDQSAYETALDLAEKALSIEPRRVSASVQKARALYELDRRQEAFDIFEKNLIEARSNADNGHYFSRILATEQEDLNRAANIARHAVFNSQHDQRTWMNLCYVYFQSGRYDLARGEALKASRSRKDEPEPFYWIGMAMHMEGNEAAAENLQKAIDMGLRGEQLETARNLLQQK